MVPQLRDRPISSEVPPPFEPSGYYAKELEKARAELTELRSITDEEASERAKASYNHEVAERQHYVEEKEQLRQRYAGVLAHITMWNPPLPYVELRDFCIQQLQESIKFDCRTSVDFPTGVERIAGSEWRKGREKILVARIAYCEKQYREECKAAEKANKWIRGLVENLDKGWS
jgi:hypothetical protein